MEEQINSLLEFGIVGGAFVLMLVQSFKREEKLMGFMGEMKDEMVKMSQAYVQLSEDVEEIRQNMNK